MREVGGIYVYGVAFLEGQGFKCAFHHSYGEAATPETIRRTVGEDERVRMRDQLAKLMPDAAGEVLSVSTCMYTNTPDQHFLIDRHPQHEQVVLACGFSGHGFKFASVVGEVLADLALEGRTKQPIELFALRRLQSRAG